MTSRPKILLRSAPSSREPGSRPTTRLPADVIATTASRIGTAALMFAAGIAVANIPAWTTSPELVMKSFGWTEGLYLLNTGSAITSSTLALLLFAGIRFNFFRQELVVRFGTLFLVLAAFDISLTTYIVPAVPLGGATWLCAWILIFPMLVPPRPGNTLKAAIMASFTATLSVALGVYLGYRESAGAEVYVLVTLPPLICTAIAYTLARLIFGLGVEARAARKLGAYELTELLGEGGMGEVWRAEHVMLRRQAAIKIVKTSALGVQDTQASTILRRFEREAQTTAALTSAHTVKLFDFGIADDGTFYYVMELLCGVTLQSLVERFGPLPPGRVARVMAQVCNSLADAHANGLVHRDIKPANIFLCRAGVDVDHVKVLDFGLVTSLAEMQNNDPRLTADGILAGTPAFMAPERASDDDHASAAIDIYALGCVAYWLLTGQLVFSENTPMAVIVAHVNEAPIPPSQRTEQDIPAELEDIVMACLAKKPEDRPARALDLMHRFEACAQNQGWSNEQAQKFWELHRPEQLPPGTKSSGSEPGNSTTNPLDTKPSRRAKAEAALRM